MTARAAQLARAVEDRAHRILVERLTAHQRGDLLRWLQRAIAHRRHFPGASVDETRAAIRALRDVPMTGTECFAAGLTQAEVDDEIRRRCEAVHLNHHPRTEDR